MVKNTDLYLIDKKDKLKCMIDELDEKFLGHLFNIVKYYLERQN